MSLSDSSYAASAAPCSTCYRVLLWERSALEERALEAWRQERAALLAQMREAGIKGARGKLAELGQQLRELSARAVEGPLATCGRSAFPHTRVSAMAAAMQAEEAVLAYRMNACSLQLLLQLTGEEGVDGLLARLFPGDEELQFCSEPLVEALAPEAAAAWQEQCRESAEAAEAAESDAETAAPEFRHVTVLAHEAVDALLPAEGRVLVDATLGGGGHSELMLQAGAEVWGIDQDPAARRAARKRLAAYGERLHVLAGNFRNAAEMLRQAGMQGADGLLADIGISSPQVDQAERGFSFLADGPLDMRMNPDAPRSAADIVNTAEEKELADILWLYGEERASRAIARRIVQERSVAPITSTTQLARIIASVLPRKGKQHPATRSFQALRIAVNDELAALEALLESGLGILKSGGRFAVITFHSLEDRAVKRYFERVCRPEIDRPEWPAPRPNPDYAAKLITRKPIVASEAELAANPRARSAKLRVIEKL